MRAVLPLLLLLALVPTPASAVSVQQIVALSNSGVSDEVILALIERDKTIFTIDPDELVALKRQGVSQTVVLAMLRSGRSQPTAPTEGDAVRTPSVAVVASVPDTVIVGHGPDRPNTSYRDGSYRDGFFSVPGTVPYFPYFVYVPVPPWSACAPRSAIASRQRPSTTTGSFGRFMNDPTARFQTDGSRRFLNNGFVSTAWTSAVDSVVVDCPQPASRLRAQIR